MKLKKIVFVLILQVSLIPASFSQVWDDNFVGIDSYIIIMVEMLLLKIFIITMIVFYLLEVV